MHNLSSAFILGYHGCDRAVGERLLQNEPFKPSLNDYDWLGSGIYFWEANPLRALEWGKRRAPATSGEPFVVGAVINPGYCLDLISSAGIHFIEAAYRDFSVLMAESSSSMPQNVGGEDWAARNLDCAIINFIHRNREESHVQLFDSVRGVFTEGEHIYKTSGFRRRTHIQLCVRNPEMIKGVFRVPDEHFASG